MLPTPDLLRLRPPAGWLLGLLPVLFWAMGLNAVALAQTERAIAPASPACQPPEASMGEPAAIAATSSSETICQSGLTLPSLWWSSEQMEQQLRTGGRLVDSWTAEPKTAAQPATVKLLVNPQIWSLMDYFERYDFINSIGLTARSFGYQTEVYSTKQQEPFGQYRCGVTAQVELSSKCEVTLNSYQFGLRRSGSLPGQR
ncbi:MAG: hypothetical protein HC824_11570 [Synechococcales cyanobacterium RM1_1_8]|nr:hypothetical protein [Synechococcales cyanobacterium RM1_1_8]